MFPQYRRLLTRKKINKGKFGCLQITVISQVTVDLAFVLDAVFMSLQQSNSAIVASFGGH